MDFDNTGASPADVRSDNTAGRITFTIAPDATCATYHFVIDAADTIFADADANQIPVDVSSTETTLIGCPEPAAAPLLGTAGLLALRRRRGALA